MFEIREIPQGENSLWWWFFVSKNLDQETLRSPQFRSFEECKESLTEFLNVVRKEKITVQCLAYKKKRYDVDINLT